MKIMIVDDHADMRRMLKNIVLISTVDPVDIVECDSGESAVSEYAFQKPDCVLMDIQLTNMTGFEATEKIYQQNPDANIIIVTSHNTPSFRIKAEKMNVMGFVLKDRLSSITKILKTITTKTPLL